MRVKVQVLRKEGRLLWSGAAEANAPGHAGILTLGEKRDPALGRTLTRVKLTSIAVGADTDLLPELLDARLPWVHEQKMRLVGFERIADVEYAQTWSIEVLPC